MFTQVTGNNFELMKIAYVFSNQSVQFVGMDKDLYGNSPKAKEMFERANEIFGYRITDIMFWGTEISEGYRTFVFLHLVITALCMVNYQLAMTVGHSLCELLVLVAAGALFFEKGLRLVYARAMTM